MILKGKRVLITGVAGTIGSAIAQRLVDSYDPSSILGLDNNESGLFSVSLQLGNCFEPILGDVRDYQKLADVMNGIDVVFHVAALKHVPLCELNPMEAIKSNVLGVQNVIRAAKKAGVEKIVYTSTDKAVNPPNVMGASKLMGEQLIRSASLSSSANRQIFTSTRFGNVLGSRGSVLPIFYKQIVSGGPVTLTSKNMTRFIMSLEESVDLVIEASGLAKGGDVFITKMRTARIEDLAKVMIQEIAPRHGIRPESIKIIETGVRPGEKMYEELMNDEETRRSIELHNHFVVLPAQRDLYNTPKSQYKGLISDKVDRPYTSELETSLNMEELHVYLASKGLFERTVLS